jgi:hypothetical protein
VEEHALTPINDAPNPPFRVGQRYENRKGIYEVISISGDALEIRLDSGEVIRTSVAFQSKILRNMEKEMADAMARKRGTSPKSFGEFFRGLDLSDFSNDVTGTHWRSREQLGGAVTKLLEVHEPFNSWSIYGRPEVHWASTARYGLNHPSLQTKFFAKVNPERVLFGLYIERSDKRTENRDDWIKFLSWCEDAEHLRWLHDVMRRKNAVMTNPYEEWPDLSFKGTIEPTEDGFSWTRDGNKTVYPRDDLPSVLRSLPENLWLNVVLGRFISRDAAIAEQAGIASSIAECFNALLPVYQNELIPD